MNKTKWKVAFLVFLLAGTCRLLAVCCDIVDGSATVQNNGPYCVCTGDVTLTFSFNVTCTTDPTITGSGSGSFTVPHISGEEDDVQYSAGTLNGSPGAMCSSSIPGNPNHGVWHSVAFPANIPGGSVAFSADNCPCDGTPPGSGGGTLYSIRVTINLGKSAGGKNAGILRLYTNTPSLALSTPAALSLISSAKDIEQIQDNENPEMLRQIMAPECFVDVVTNSMFKYSVKIYNPSDVEANLDTNGYYVVIDGRTPFTTWEFENPSGTTNDVNTLRVARISGETTEYTFEYENGDWAMAAGAPGTILRKEELNITTNEDAQVKTRLIKGADDVVVSKTRKTYRMLAWGRSELVERVTDPDGAALTQTIAYGEDEGETGKYSRVVMQVNTDGSWQRNDEYDSQGRLTVAVSSWQNAATNASANEARAVYSSYESVYPYYVVTNIVVTNGMTNEVVMTNVVDNGTVNFSSPRTTTEKILGDVVGKTYFAYYSTNVGDRVEIEEKCADTNAIFGASSNLRTVRIYNVKDETSPGSEKLQSMTYPDGRQETYTYEKGVYQTNADPAQCSFTVNTIGEYVRVTCVHGTTDNPDGIANKTTKEVTIENYVGRTVMQETYAYSGGSSYTRIAWVVNILDDFGRPANIYKSNGAHSETTWGCCGKEWEKDENGVEYAYMYDALHRLTQKVKQGISAGEYLAQADQYTTYTYDAEGRQLTATVSAGGLSQVSSNTYDLAGRLTKSVNASGLVTEYAYADSGRTTTETLPGGYTRITERYKDGQVKSITGTGQIPQYYAYGVNEDGTKWAKVYSASNNSPVWVKTTTDLLGRTAKVEKPSWTGTEIEEYSYNSKGQLARRSHPGEGVADTLFAYDEMGNQIRSGLDVNANGALDLAGLDRINEVDTSYVSYSSDWFLQTVSKVYATDNSATPTTTSTTRQRLTGFSGALVSETLSFDALGNETVSQTTIDRNSKLLTQTVDVPTSSSNVITIAVNGLVQSSTTAHGLQPTVYSYDPLARRTGTTDPRTGTATTHYDSHGWVDYTEDAAGNRTTFTYDSATGRRLSQVDPLSNTSYSSFTSYGQLEKTWGSAAYPVRYEYDGYDRMIKMNTYRTPATPELWSGGGWPASPGTADTTEWIYHEASGLLTAKKDAAGKQVSYTYSSGGRLASRTWARKVDADLRAAYSYNAIGELTNIDYSDSTPDVSFTYDRLGRQKTADSSASAHTFAYNGLLLDTETVVSSTGTNVIDRSYDGYGRSTGFALDANYSVAYGFNSLGRFSSVSFANASYSSSMSYSYLANSDLISQQSTAYGLQSTRAYEDHRNLLTQVKNSIGTDTISQYDYANDAGGRRTSVKQSGTGFQPVGNAFNLYGYNSRNEVITADRYWGANLNDISDPVSGQSFAYGYDNIGNRTASLRENEEMNYTANNLNQYTQRTIPDGIDVIGSAETNATVTVNNGAVTRHGKYWHKAMRVNNANNTVFQDISVVGVYNPPGTNDPDIVSSETGHVFVAKTPEQFSYDDDGNMTSDGRFNYAFDSENRLIGAETLSTLPSSVPRVKLEFAYDYMSRRVGKKVHKYESEIWNLQSEMRFAYDGWNLIQEVVQRPAAAPSTHSIQGQLNINPNNSPQNEFALTLPNGSTITRNDLIQSYGGYSGPATGIHVKPKGNGRQAGLVVDGAAYALSNSETCDIISGAMTVNLYNDSIKNGKAMGRWWISIVAADAAIAIGGAEEIGNQQSTITNSYVWGLDLSGSLQGAGGIGGLVSVTRSTSSGTATYYPCYDGNGNITDYVDTNGVVVAHREYDPFGNTIVATGPMVNDFSFWFSTKYLDQETGLYYYGYRYSPSLGRWLSRDPIGELGGLNLYAIVGNNPVGWLDNRGLVVINIHVSTQTHPKPYNPNVYIEGISGKCECFNGDCDLACSINAPITMHLLEESAYPPGSHPSYEDHLHHESAEAGRAVAFVYDQEALMEPFEKVCYPVKGTCEAKKQELENAFVVARKALSNWQPSGALEDQWADWFNNWWSQHHGDDRR